MLAVALSKSRPSEPLYSTGDRNAQVPLECLASAFHRIYGRRRYVSTGRTGCMADGPNLPFQLYSPLLSSPVSSSVLPLGLP